MRRWISSACHSTMCGAPSPFPVHTAHPPPQGCGNPLCGPPVFATCAAAHALSTRSPPLPVQMIKTSGRGRGRGGGRGGGRGRGGAFKRGGGAKQAAAAAIQKPGGGIQKKTLSQMSAAAQSLSRAGGLTTGATPILGAHATLRALPPRARHTRRRLAPGTKLRVGNLARSVSSDDLSELFAEMGELKSAEVRPCCRSRAPRARS